MAAKVFIQSVDRRSIEKAKRCKAENLVRQLLAVQVSRYLYQRLRIKPTDEITANPSKSYIPFGLEPSIDSQIGVIVKVPALPGQVRFRAIQSCEYSSRT